ncbi:MAG: DUF4406 domain-containing protein [Nitrospiria bacterium]
MKLVYIAGKYRSKEGPSGIWDNIQFARQYAIKYWKSGHAVICPHMNTSMLDGVGTDDIFLNGDKEMLKRCDAIVMIPGWQESEGACAELECAKENNLEVIYEQ